jgi:hypothetical protein
MLGLPAAVEALRLTRSPMPQCPCQWPAGLVACEGLPLGACPVGDRLRSCCLGFPAWVTVFLLINLHSEAGGVGYSLTGRVHLELPCPIEEIAISETSSSNAECVLYRSLQLPNRL